MELTEYFYNTVQDLWNTQTTNLCTSLWLTKHWIVKTPDGEWQFVWLDLTVTEWNNPEHCIDIKLTNWETNRYWLSDLIIKY